MHEKNRTTGFVWIVVISLSTALIEGCGSGISDLGRQLPPAAASGDDLTVVGPPLKGKWRGTTSQGKPITFRVSDDGTVISYMRIEYGTGTLSDRRIA